MSAVVVRLVKIAVLGVVGVLAIGMGIWTYLRVGLLAWLAGPVLGLSLLLYTAYYVWTIV